MSVLKAGRADVLKHLIKGALVLHEDGDVYTIKDVDFTKSPEQMPLVLKPLKGNSTKKATLPEIKGIMVEVSSESWRR